MSQMTHWYTVTEAEYGETYRVRTDGERVDVQRRVGDDHWTTAGDAGRRRALQAVAMHALLGCWDAPAGGE